MQLIEILFIHLNVENIRCVSPPADGSQCFVPVESSYICLDHVPDVLKIEKLNDFFVLCVTHETC